MKARPVEALESSFYLPSVASVVFCGRGLLRELLPPPTTRHERIGHFGLGRSANT